MASDGQKWAEGLILQLPATHDGRNSWLLNHGQGHEAVALRWKWNRRAERDQRPGRAVYRAIESLQPAPLTRTERFTGDYAASFVA